MTFKKVVGRKIDPITNNILYRKITNKDFNESTYDTEILEINPNPDGYISNELIKEIDYDTKNTTIFNIGTGQGKSTAINEIANQYFQKGFIVLIASPTKNLVSKYTTKILETIPDTAISDYTIFNGIVKNEELEDAIKKNLHIITINGLLENPGDDFFFQNSNKKKYFEGIRNRCLKECKNIVIIFDEIHEGIYNFKSQLFFNVLKYRDLVHKIIFSSATFTEPSLIVVKKLAIMTDYKIKVLNAPRVKHPKQADLRIFFTDESYSAGYLNPLAPMIDKLKEAKIKGKSVNVLTYSKNLAKALCHQPSNDKINFTKALQSIGELNLITSETDNKFDHNQVNIGTTFKSGIDILDENTFFFVILPPTNAVSNLVRSGDLGIFTNGYTELIQALARVRNGGDIFVLTAYPPSLINGDNGYIEKLSTVLPNFLNYPKSNFFSTNEQIVKLNEYYNEIAETVEKERIFLENEKNTKKEIPSIRFPSFDEWCLINGQKYLSSNFEMFGHRTIPYLVWAAMNDQFQNCTLKRIGFIPEGDFEFSLRKEEQNFGIDLLNKFINYFGTETVEIYEVPLIYSKLAEEISHLELYRLLINILKDNKLTVGDTVKKSSNIEKTAKIVRSVLAIINTFRLHFNTDRPNFGKKIGISDYLLNNISLAKFVKKNEVKYKFQITESRELVDAYCKLGETLEKFKTSVGQLPILYKNYSSLDSSVITDELAHDLIESYKVITSNDKFINKPLSTFSFLQNLEADDDMEKIKSMFYPFLLKICLVDTKDKKKNDKPYYRYYISNSFKELPPPRNTMNLIFPELPHDFYAKGYERIEPARFQTSPIRFKPLPDN